MQGSSVAYTQRLIFYKIFCVFVIFCGLAACTKRPTAPSTSGGDSFASLEQAAAKAPTFLNWIALGLAYSGASRHADAVEAYKKAITADPNSPVGWNNLCSSYNAMGKFVDAIPYCEKAIAIAPDFDRAKANLQAAQNSLESQKKEVLERNKNWKLRSDLRAEDYISIGLEYYGVRTLDNALEAWGKVRRDDPLYATALSNMTSAYILMGRYSAAEKAINEALKIDPKNQLFQNNKAWLESARTQKK